MLRDGPMIDAHRVTLSAEDDFDGWRESARDLAEAGVPPEAVVWSVEGSSADLFGVESAQPRGASFAVPRNFINLAKSVICHSDFERFALLYAMLWKLRTNRGAMEDRADPLLDRLERLAKEVRRDVHKMHAFVRFREVEQPDGSMRFIAFFEPDHHIVRHTAGFFVRRFSNMRWSILTPELSIHWDGETLTEGPGATRAEAPGGDPLEAMWKTYYASIFNPARLKVGAMLREMPKKYWRNMPETSLVQPLIAGARAREIEMIDRAAAKEGLKDAIAAERRVEPGGNLRASWEALMKEARGCTRCDLYKYDTQTVFGEGPLDAQIMFVGEQPGDQEDLAGRPFVGPAGQVFDRALAAAGVERGQAYVTNAVKHFKHELRGKRRLHKTPDAGEVQACRWWLDNERRLVRPRVVVALGATAALAVLGRPTPIGKSRGQALQLPDQAQGVVTYHPSFLLRLPDPAAKSKAFDEFVADLKFAKGLLAA